MTSASRGTARPIRTRKSATVPCPKKISPIPNRASHPIPFEGMSAPGRRGGRGSSTGVRRMNRNASTEQDHINRVQPVQLVPGQEPGRELIGQQVGRAGARGSRNASDRPMTPTSELMMPKVTSGVADRAAVAMIMDTTAPRANPAGARSTISSHTDPVNSDSRLNTHAGQGADEINAVWVHPWREPGQAAGCPPQWRPTR